MVKKISSLPELERLRSEIAARRGPEKKVIAVCVGGCSALGARKIVDSLRDEVEKQGLAGQVGIKEDEVEIRETGCLGFCEFGPRVTVYPGEIPYTKVKPGDASEIVSETVVNGRVVERLLYADPDTGERARKLEDIPFHKHQLMLLLKNNALIDPKKIEDYIALGGYRALGKALSQMTPEQVMGEVKKSNLRGRGGGGFPTGRKWETVRNAPGEPKYVIVNCDEGDPGAFMDRSLMEGNPHSVLEGLIIGAYAMGANEGFIYVREEYPLAAENVSIAIKQAEEYGLLGEDILGSGFNFRVEVHRGAGAFVSGESSALIAAIEGEVGEPRPKYIHTAVRGLWEKPTCLNNVETWANIPLIVLNGADWFRSMGTENSSGTKIFSLVGKVNNTGLVEVPMGITLRDLIFKIGGGIRGGKKFKAVQTGGPSGGFIPEKHLDLPIDFDELAKVGSMMGSGGVIVMDEDTCIVDVTRYYMDFLSNESCGKCVPCREGLKQILSILNRICSGLGEEKDFKDLEDLSWLLKEASLCALGTTAANPLVTSLTHFRGEYEAHIRERRCPAKVCRALVAYYVQPEKCQACTRCSGSCPVGAITGDKDTVHVIDQEKCIKCGACYEECPFDAIEKLSPPMPPPPRRGVKVIRKKRGE